jgi:hypothetical protein
MDSMNRAVLKLLSLCVLVLGLVAFSATAAQAAGTWMVGGKNLTSTAQNTELVGTIDAPDGALLAKLGLNAVAFLCKAGQLINAKLEPEGAISEASKNAKVVFSECTTVINGKEAAKCQPKATGKVAGTIETEEGSALLTEHSAGDGVTVITPKVGATFAIFRMEASCAIGSEVEVFGKLALHDVGVELNADELETERQNHLVSEFAALTELTVANKESKSKATLDGMADIKTVGGGNWSGLRPNRRTVLAVGGTNTNPFDLNAEIIAGGGGGTCTVGAVFASLTACTTTAMFVIWKAL